MRAASEHPRIATAIAAALIVLAVAGVGVSRALGGAQRIRDQRQERFALATVK